MTSIQINLPPVPAELKNISTYISRAQELKGKEPIIAYYCLLHATQTGISAKEKESKAFLMSLMTILENMKEQLKDHKEITSDPAAATYIENFAIKVFNNADNEDRKGGSTRSTAKKFLAASNFFELLSMFEAKYLNPNILAEEKIKYSKWKAADIAKAYREGRAPNPGPVAPDGFGDERPVTPHSELEDASSSGYSKHGTTIGGRASPNLTNEIAPDPPSYSKPPLHNTDSSSSEQTLAPPKPAAVTPKHISTTSHMQSPYVVDLSSPASSTGLRTPFKSPGFSDGGWSTAATPGLESPNMFAAYGASMAGKPGINIHPANLALLNAMKGLSPTSPMQRSPLGGNVITAANGINKGADRPDQKHSEEGVDTDEEDGQWSTAGNDPFSRQNSMMPLSSAPSFSNAHSGPSLVVTSSLGAVQEESPSKPPKTPDAHTIPTTQVLMVPLPPSASNSASSSPQLRPDSVTFAAQQPLPPVLPPATQTPSSIKSDSHVLPQGPLDDSKFTYTTSIVGDSMSDGEASYHVRRRANSVSASQKNTAHLPAPGSGHARASSINTVASPSKDATPTQTNGLTSPASAPPSSTRAGRLSPEEEDWERSSLSRLARLPDNRSGEDISRRLRDLGSYDSSSTSTSPPPVAGTQDEDTRSRRNTLRAGPAPVSGDFSAFSLPGVPSAPPVDDWKDTTDKRSGGSDSDSGGDIAARLPSAPPFLPTVQDQMPHITVLARPMSPKEDLRVNPYFPQVTPNGSVGPSPDAESPITPRNPSDQKPSTVSSYSNGVGGPNVPTTPNHMTSPSSASTISQPGPSIHRGYTPPNSVVSPSQSSTMSTGSVPIHGAMQHPQVFSPPPPPIPQAGAYLPSQYSQPAAPIYYSNQVPTNGTTSHRDEFGLEVPGRPPPTELEPEVLGKVQKHAKYALSALNFEDLDTAREELKKALRLLY